MAQIHIFVSYSHDDARWFDEEKLMPRLIKSLEILGAEVWFDRRRLGGGDPWKQEIVDAIKRAHIAVLLVSRNFLNSDFIREIELPRVERRFEQGELIVVPILVGHCNWQNVRVLARPQMVPGKPTPLISYLDSPAEWDRVQEEIFSAIERQVDRVRKNLGIAAPLHPGTGHDPSTTLTRLSGVAKLAPPVVNQNKKNATEKSSPEKHSTPAWVMPVVAAGLAALITASVFVIGSPFGATESHPTDAASTNTSGNSTSIGPASPVNQSENPGPDLGATGVNPGVGMPVSTPQTSAPAPMNSTPTQATAADSATPSAPGPAPSKTKPALALEPVAPKPSAPNTAVSKPKPVPAPESPQKTEPLPPQPATERPVQERAKEVVEDAAVDFLRGKLNKTLGN